MNNLTKISLTQCIRTLINIVVVLVILWAISLGIASYTAWEIVTGTILMWFVGDLLLSIYLEILFQREGS